MDLAANKQRNSSTESKEVREIFTKYFMKKGHVNWQWEKLPDFQRAKYEAEAEKGAYFIIFYFVNVRYINSFCLPPLHQ